MLKSSSTIEWFGDNRVTVQLTQDDIRAIQLQVNRIANGEGKFWQLTVGTGIVRFALVESGFTVVAGKKEIEISGDRWDMKNLSTEFGTFGPGTSSKADYPVMNISMESLGAVFVPDTVTDLKFENLIDDPHEANVFDFKFR